MKTNRKDDKLTLEKDTLKHLKALTVRSGMKTGEVYLPPSKRLGCTTLCPM